MLGKAYPKQIRLKLSKEPYIYKYYSICSLGDTSLKCISHSNIIGSSDSQLREGDNCRDVEHLTQTCIFMNT